MEVQMDARKFWAMCRLHDWHYEMADDSEVYRTGEEAHYTLTNLAYSDPVLTPIFEAWREYHYNAGARPAEPKMED
jgi:hypothetical protein